MSKAKHRLPLQVGGCGRGGFMPSLFGGVRNEGSPKFRRNFWRVGQVRNCGSAPSGRSRADLPPSDHNGRNQSSLSSPSYKSEQFAMKSQPGSNTDCSKSLGIYSVVRFESTGIHLSGVSCLMSSSSKVECSNKIPSRSYPLNRHCFVQKSSISSSLI